jgi:hypothetical protein
LAHDGCSEDRGSHLRGAFDPTPANIDAGADPM